MLKRVVFLFLLVFSISALAETCEVHFEDLGPKKKLQKFIEEDFAGETKILEKFKKLTKEETATFLDTISSYEYAAFKKAVVALKNKPQHFERLGSFNTNIFIREIAESGSALKRFKRNENWTYAGQSYDYEIPAFKPGVTTTLKEKDIRTALVSIKAFFDDSKKVYARMQDFEDEVMIECLKNDPKYLQKEILVQYKIREKAMNDVLGRLEKEHGFKSTSASEYKPLILEDKSYSLSEWFAMLKKGQAFNDSGFLSGQDADNIVEFLEDIGNRGGHGYYTHRIQWYVMMKDMNDFPAKYKGLKAVEIFKKLGDLGFNKKMGQANDAGDTIWQNLFDSFSGSYHQPEFFRQTHGDYPDLGSWL